MSKETIVRVATFPGVLTVISTWEVGEPRRSLSASKMRRWFHSLSVVFIDSLALRLAVPIAAVGTAAVAQEYHWGLLNLVLPPQAPGYVVSIRVWDLVIYPQHEFFHAAPPLRRVHRMHHTDRDLDATSGLRFHPLESLLSMFIRMGAVLLIGPPPGAVLGFEILLNATSVFNHGNVRIPGTVDCALRWIRVTPDMHRAHHSVERKQTDSNFGFNLPWWNRLFGTYRAEPEKGQERIVIGQPDCQDERPLRLGWMFRSPFLSRKVSNSHENSVGQVVGPGKILKHVKEFTPQ